MKNLYKNYDKFNKVRNLTIHHPKARIRKKNRSRLKKNYIRYGFSSKIYITIFGKNFPRKKIKHIIAQVDKLKYVHVPYPIHFSNSLKVPLDVIMKLYSHKGIMNYGPKTLELNVNERLPDYDITKQRIINERNNILNE